MFINSLDDFYIHTKNHINNVNILASKLMDVIEHSKMLRKYYHIPNDIDFQNLKEEVLAIIKEHDKAKICLTPEFLKENNLEKPLYEQLYSRFGKGKDPKEWAITWPIVQKLNAIDEKIIQGLISNFVEWKRSLILSIESLADKIERGSNPITPEEMGAKPMKASDFLTGQINEYEMAMVKVLEEQYFEHCVFEPNKQIFSKKKYWDFIISHNLQEYVLEDDLCFKLKDNLMKKINNLQDETSERFNYDEKKAKTLEEVFNDEFSKERLNCHILIENDSVSCNIFRGKCFEKTLFSLPIEHCVLQKESDPAMLMLTDIDSPLYSESFCSEHLLSSVIDEAEAILVKIIQKREIDSLTN